MYLVKDDTAQPEQDLPLSNAGLNVTMRIRSKKFLVSYVVVKGASKGIRAELQMWRGFRLRPYATSHRPCSRAAAAVGGARSREGFAEMNRRMYVKITCLQDAFYNTIYLKLCIQCTSLYVVEENALSMLPLLWVLAASAFFFLWMCPYVSM